MPILLKISFCFCLKLLPVHAAISVVLFTGCLLFAHFVITSDNIRIISDKNPIINVSHASDLESAEELYQRRITRIMTTDFPKYFAVITRIRHDTALLGPDGGRMSSKVNPQVQAVFPPTALTKPIKVGLQVIKKS